MKILRYDEGRIGITDGAKVVDVCDLIDTDASEWIGRENL